MKLKMAPALIILLLFGLVFFAAGCAAPEQPEEDAGLEEPVVDETETNDETDSTEKTEQSEEKKDEIIIPYECGIRLRALRHETASGTRQPSFPLSPDSRYLVASDDSVVKLYSYPDQDLIYTHDFDSDLVIQSYYWHPDGETLLLFASSESYTEVHLYLLDVEGGKQKIKSFDNAQFGTNRICLEALEFRVGFIEWGLQGEAAALDFHYRDYSTIKLVNLEGDVLFSKEWNDRSFLRDTLANPDGSKIAFTRFGTAKEDLWLWDLEEETLRQITDDGDGNYPYLWLQPDQLLVSIGAVGPGGGQIYGMALIDLESGKKVKKYSQDNKLFVSNTISEDKNLVLGTKRDMAGTNARVCLLDLDSGEFDYLLDNFNTVHAKWADEDLAILYLQGWEDPEEAYKGREDYHLLKTYSEEAGLTTLVESSEQIFLLGTADGEVHYLQPAPGGNWRWLTTTLD